MVADRAMASDDAQRVFERRLAVVRDRIAIACSQCGREPETVELLAVSKRRTADEVSRARSAGLVCFGENRVQELVAKARELTGVDVRWQLIGSLPGPSGLVPVCGDGFVQQGEECDDGNLEPGDGCSVICDLEGDDCQDGIDNDADDLVDYPDDPGCRTTTSSREDRQCDDDLDNDGDGRVDWDGGSGGGTPDPQCGAGWRNREQPPPDRCGLGFESALLLPALMGLRARRRRVCGPGFARFLLRSARREESSDV